MFTPSKSYVLAGVLENFSITRRGLQHLNIPVRQLSKSLSSSCGRPSGVHTGTQSQIMYERSSALTATEPQVLALSGCSVPTNRQNIIFIRRCKVNFGPIDSYPPR